MVEKSPKIVGQFISIRDHLTDWKTACDRKVDVDVSRTIKKDRSRNLNFLKAPKTVSIIR